MLKCGRLTLAPILAKIFNGILVNGQFPKSWRISTLTVLHKKGDKCNPKNYRGIAVSSNLCKLFCLILHNRLTNFTNTTNIIPREQIGFQKGARTQDHILVLKTVIDKYISNLNNVYVCFFYFSSAFDTIWWSALMYYVMSVLVVVS